MSVKKINLTKKAAAGVALVVLSGAVPQPLVGVAEAATATINLSGSFITGIALTASASANFGSIAVSTPTGTAKVSTAGVFSGDGVAVGGGLANGVIKFKAVNTTPNVDITVKVTEAQGLTLAPTLGLAPAAGTILVDSVTLGNIGAAAEVMAFGAGTTAKKAAYNITSATTNLNIGMAVSWSVTQPIGIFASPLIVTIAY